MAVDDQLLRQVEHIVDRVRVEGDAALLGFTEKYDRVRVMPSELEVGANEIEEAYSLVTGEQIAALRESKRKLQTVESKRRERLEFTVELDGVKVRSSYRPLRRVGCYVPGGGAAYPSSLVMSATPAKVAGVDEVIVCTPPRVNGGVDPITLVAADICGVDRVFKVGGAQAVAAMAYGTGMVPRVDKIVGPGNRYVTAAKVIVSEAVAIDKLAGPTEVLVLADDSADPRLIALDMISQAEHGPGGLVGLVTTSRSVADNVEKLLLGLMGEVPRGDVVMEALGSGGFIYVADSLEGAAEFANAFAPEHLEVMTDEPGKVAGMITSAGLILLGRYTPVSSTDYCMGVNHILPTGGYARVSPGTTVLDYLKPVTIVESTVGGLESVRGHVHALSEAEGLPNHSLAVDGRFTP